MKTKLVAILALALLSSINSQLSTVFAQSSLTPPGAPGPTMLTLQQIEPRTPVDSAHTGSGGSSEFLITQPGSYYLTTNIVGVSGLNGINISANNVTLDLNGFSVQGISGAWSGIYIHAGYTNVAVRNGNISGWSSSGRDGIECYANNVALERLNVSASGNAGVYSANAVQLSRVQVVNSGWAGISVGAGSTLNECSAQGNGTDGFQGSDHCAFTTCTSLGNQNNGFNLLGADCSVISCTAGGNAIYGFLGNHNSIFKDCSATGNTNTGIYAINYNNCVIQNCTAMGNGGDGIEAGNNCGIENCASAGNGSGEVPVDGIAVGNGCAVRDCFSANNVSNGISAGNGCVIERCTAATNGTVAPFASGINCGTGCVVEHCNATGTRTEGAGISCAGGLISDCVASGNTSFGIAGSQPNCVVRNCQSQNNGRDSSGDIGVGAGSTVSGCVVSEPYNSLPDCIIAVGDGCQIIGNTSNGGYNGVRVESNNCRIDGNHCDSASFGIQVDSGATNNVVVRNSVAGSSVQDYNIGAGNDVGPIGTAATATSPWANMAH